MMDDNRLIHRSDLIQQAGNVPRLSRTERTTMLLRKMGLFTLAVIVLMVSLGTAGIASNIIGISFPKLTGPYSVGRASYDLMDPTRKEIFGSDPNANRAIVITVYYPAAPAAGAKPAAYASGKMAELLAGKAHLPAPAFQLIHSHAYENAPVAEGRFPVVLFSPGIGTPPLEYTSAVEDLASHGYIVVEIYHTYSVPATIFADGRIAMLSDAGFRSEIEPDSASQAQIDSDRNQIGSVWTADARFTLDELTKLNGSDALLKGHLDLNEVGMYGHSFGGATAAEVLSLDKRFKAGINMDGTAFPMTNASQITQPFLWMASDYSTVSDGQLAKINMTRSEFDAKMKERNEAREAFLKLLPAGTLFVLKGSTHSSYITDEDLFGGSVPGMSDPLASIDGTQAVSIIDRYVAAFFDQYLKHQPTELLNGNPSSYPEVSLMKIQK